MEINIIIIIYICEYTEIATVFYWSFWIRFGSFYYSIESRLSIAHSTTQQYMHHGEFSSERLYEIHSE